MSGAGVSLLCSVLVAAVGARVDILKGWQGQSVSFPPPRPAIPDIARVTWSTRGTHLAEAKPRHGTFSLDFLPEFRGRLRIHPTNLSLEIRQLRPEDGGAYEVVVDTWAQPSAPKTQRYYLRVRGASGGHGDTTATPGEVTEPPPGHPTTRDTGRGQPEGGPGGQGTCGGCGHYCELRGYLVAAVLGPLLVAVAVVTAVTRDKATGLGDSRGSSPWQR